MKKAKKVVRLSEATRSRVDVEFINKSSLPKDRAIHVAAMLAGTSDRAARKQYNKSQKPTIDVVA